MTKNLENVENNSNNQKIATGKIIGFIDELNQESSSMEHVSSKLLSFSKDLKSTADVLQDNTREFKF